jgi:hypothetical protein
MVHEGLSAETERSATMRDALQWAAGSSDGGAITQVERAKVWCLWRLEGELVWVRKASMSWGRYWMLLSRFLAMAASWPAARLPGRGHDTSLAAKALVGVFLAAGWPWPSADVFLRLDW